MSTGNRRPNRHLEDVIEVPFSHAAVTADTGPTKIWRGPAGRAARIESVRYIEPATGLAASATDFFNLKLQHGGTPTVLANRSTELAVGSSIAANTFTTFTLAANPVLPADTDLELLLDETGTASLPAGNGFILIRLL